MVVVAKEEVVKLRRRRSSRPRGSRRTSRPRLEPNIADVHTPSMELAERLVAATAHDSLEPNRASRLRGPSMETRFGSEVDPDDVPGRALDAAMDRYEIFHDKSPIRVAELEHEIPREWVRVGDALAVMYRTDKWKKDGVDEDYKHLHDKSDNKPYEKLKGVRLYEPARSGGALPVARSAGTTPAMRVMRPARATVNSRAKGSMEKSVQGGRSMSLLTRTPMPWRDSHRPKVVARSTITTTSEAS